MRKLYSKIEELLELQHGAIARYQFADLNISNSSIDTLIKNRSFKRSARGVYVLSGIRTSWKLRASIAVLSCGRYSMLSHESALVNSSLLDQQLLHGYRKRREYGRRELIHVICKRTRRFDQDVYFHRSKRIEDYISAITIDGIKQVPIERAIIDTAQQLTDSELDYLIYRSIAAGHISPESLSKLLVNIPTAPGREKKRTALLLKPYMQTGSCSSVESFLEKRVERILNNLQPGYVSQFTVFLNRSNYRLDFAYPDLKIAIEVDGYFYHSHRGSFDSDRKRQNDLVMNGWKVIRITAAFTDDQIREVLSNALGHALVNNG